MLGSLQLQGVEHDDWEGPVHAIPDQQHDRQQKTELSVAQMGPVEQM